MHDVERIKRALDAVQLRRDAVEHRAQDLQSVSFPGLSPIPGGTDWGRDADITANPAGRSPDFRLMATMSRSQDGVRKNMGDEALPPKWAWSRGTPSVNDSGSCWSHGYCLRLLPELLRELRGEAVFVSCLRGVQWLHGMAYIT